MIMSDYCDLCKNHGIMSQIKKGKPVKVVVSGKVVFMVAKYVIAGMGRVNHLVKVVVIEGCVAVFGCVYGMVHKHP